RDDGAWSRRRGDRRALPLRRGRRERSVHPVRRRRPARPARAIHRRGVATYPRRASMNVRFDQAAPYEVEEVDAPFAKPEGRELLARIYRPRGEADAPLAVLVEVHGGAWSRNDRLSHAVHGRGLAASGLMVVSLDFRRGSEAKHPAAGADVAAGGRRGGGP